MLIKCDCGKSFPFNPDKHKHDSVVFCPFCRGSFNNIWRRRGWRPSFRWVKEKLLLWQIKSDAKKVLDKYFATMPVRDSRGRILRWNYSFSLERWLNGERPTVTREQILQALGPNPSNEAVLAEMKNLSNHGVKVPEWIET